jgi:ATP-dependent exoDNAse (exonuclease V) beta subunit
MNLTQAQLEVIAADGGHLLVAAGAGTGKTTTVVQALCRQLGVAITANGTVVPAAPRALSIEQVAAITYTNQAAADLKRKLRTALRGGGRADLAAEVDAARIGTIHSFCGELLRDFALRAGARPARRVLEDGEAGVVAHEAAHDALAAAIEQRDIAGLDVLLTNRKLKTITEWIASAAQNADRLAKWEAARGTLRNHECALLDLAHRAMELRRARLDREGVLDFDQMIVAARDLLHNADVRHAAQRRIRLLVLDEFQDVDPAQRDIAFLLGGITEPDADATRLILVGDPKQSIYRFRRADVTLWNDVEKQFRAGRGDVLPLSENFRSKAAILGMVDCVVGTVLGRPVAKDGARRGFEVDYVPLVAKAHGSEGDRAVELLVVRAKSDGKPQKAGDVRAVEAESIAKRIAELKASGTPYGDIAILLAGWGDVGTYERALSRAGVPSYLLKSEGFWDTREVIDCVLALRAIRNPGDDVALVGFLKSPFVGARDDTLLALARAANGTGLNSALAALQSERPLIERAIELLESFGALRDRLPVHDLLRRLIADSGFLGSLALHAAGGAQAVANVRKLLRFAAAAPDQSLGGFLQEIAEQRDRKDRVAPERLYRERSDVVTISTIHSAKGLEWPVVCWCDMVREVTLEKEKFLAGRDAFSVKDESLVDDDGEVQDPVHTAMAEQLVLEQRAEAARLWYVASTRARNRLILSGIPLGTAGRGAMSPAAEVRATFPALGEANEVEYTASDGAVYHAAVTLCAALAESSTAEARAAAEIELRLPPAALPVPSGSARLSATQLMAFDHDPQQWHDWYVVRAVDAAGAGAGRAAARAVSTGIIVHEVLEKAGLDDADIAELIEGAIASTDEDAPEADSTAGIAYRTLVRARVDAATSSAAWKSVADQPSARRELAFTRLLADGTAISGALDLVARVGDGVRIMDIKTSSAGGAELAARYAVQAAVYADAVRTITGATEVAFALLPLPSGIAVEVQPTQPVDAIVAKLRASRHDSQAVRE